MNLSTVTLSVAGVSPIVLGVVDRTGGSASGFTLESARINPADRMLYSENLPLVPGGVVTPGRMGSRTVELAGTVVAGTSAGARSLLQQLVAVVTDRAASEITVEYDNGQGTVALTGYLDGTVETEAIGGPFLSYALRILCADPVAKTPFEYSGGFGSYPGATIENNGNAETWPRIEVAVGAGVTGVRIGNSTRGWYLDFDDITSGTLSVDLTPGYESAELNGTSCIGKLSYASRFFPIAPGDNGIYVTVTSGAGSVSGTIYWRYGWAA